ncbi:MAG: serine/threonine protein kinase [Proteobacteria bacterium]|nr:serine/threonine protein kinase [Pseudomonadota bacterium]
MTTDNALPLKFGHYYLYDYIGRGGMAEIFLAKTHTELGTERICVIKRILPELNRNREFCEMLINEAKLCAQLSHANVVQTYELGHIDDQFYIAMEYVEGVDLNRLLGLLTRAQTALPLPFALFIIVETLRGLDYAHRLTDASGAPLHIIHRDVSPTNVLISTEGEVKLCDFGIAKVQQSEGFADTHSLEDSHIKGKVAYMAPEHIAGSPIDQRADLFAAGILLWELLHGRRLYKSKDHEETLRRAKAADIPPLEDRDFPEFEMLAAIVRKALAKEPDHRFASGQEFIRALEDYMHISGIAVSQLRFSDFLMENVGENLKAQRREREQHLAALLAVPNEPDESTGETVRLREETARFTQSLLGDEIDDDDDEIDDDDGDKTDSDDATRNGDRASRPADSGASPAPTDDALDSAARLAAKFEREQLTSPSASAEATSPAWVPWAVASGVLAALLLLSAHFLGWW